MRTIVITGASDGIGAAAARQLSGLDDRLILVGRSPEKTARIAAELGAEHHLADFSDLAQVRALARSIAESVDRIDVLANNAGGIFSGPSITGDGFELTFQVNHLAGVLLTHDLRSLLAAGDGVVIQTSSVASRMLAHPDLDDVQTLHRYSASRAYGNAKLANVLFTTGLAARPSLGLSPVAFHPGIVATSFAQKTSSPLGMLYRSAAARFLSTPEQGGARLSQLIVGRPGVDFERGAYYAAPDRIGRSHRMARDLQAIARHWELTSQLLGLDW